jgi:flagellar hook-basal body complex protein FliE
MNIDSIRPLFNLENAARVRPEAKTNEAAGQAGFSFNQALESLSQTQNDSDMLVQKLAAGEDVDLHQVMIASEETDINFRIAVAIRDRLVEAYREVMRMAV